jgi:hypothetical protein
MAFKGYLLKVANKDIVFPHEYIQLGTWESTPNQREEIKAYRDDNTRNLTRVTAQGTKTAFSFTTRPNLHLTEKQEIQEFFTKNEEIALERKIKLEYWNDEENTYKTGYFYRPDINFPIKKITENDIIYGELKLEFVEY